MSTGIETAEVVEPWLYGTLAADEWVAAAVEGLIVNSADDAEKANAEAWVEFALVSARDVRGVGVVRVQVDALYQVKVVVRGTSYDPASVIFSRVNRLLETSDTVSTPAGDLTCIRETIVQYPELEDGIQYRHLGGTFRVRVNSTP